MNAPKSVNEHQSVTLYHLAPFLFSILAVMIGMFLMMLFGGWRAFFANETAFYANGFGTAALLSILFGLNQIAIRGVAKTFREEMAEQMLEFETREKQVQEQVLESYCELSALLYKAAESLTRGRFWVHILKSAARHPDDEGFSVYNLKTALKTIRIILIALGKLNRTIEANARKWVESDLKYAASAYALKDNVLAGWEQILPTLLATLNGTEDIK